MEAKCILFVPVISKSEITFEKRELVQCKDCKYRYEHDDGEDECEKFPGWFPVKPNWFCADGVKKD